MNKKELKKLILEEKSHIIYNFYQFEKSKKKRIEIVDNLIEFLSEKDDQFRAEVISFFGSGFILGAPTEVYERIMLQKEKVLKTIKELLNHDNSSIKEEVLSAIPQFEDLEDNTVYFLEQCTSRVLELLSDQNQNIQREAGQALMILAISKETNKKYRDFLEIPSLLHHNETIFSYAVNYARTKDVIIRALNEIKEGNDISLREEATKMLEDVLRVIKSKDQPISKLS